MTSICTSLRDFRRQRGLTLEDVARTFGVNKTSVMRWEDKIPARRLAALERFTGIQMGVLRPDLFPADAVSGDPAKVSEPAPSSTSQPDAETFACPTHLPPPAEKNLPRST